MVGRGSFHWHQLFVGMLGILEAFHEGWYHASIWENLALTFVQYMSPMLLFIAAGLVGIRWPIVGAGLFVAMAVGVALFFRGAKSDVPGQTSRRGLEPGP